ncbi:hypothetical protein HWE04_07895 [Herbaspirillum sp. C7C2]|uniref:hypothetical protein n=1 Tax=Herbaspirillum sp. C7C2 TaxID=2736666 RepID=UPI001F521FA8|nr:hypothetical protein [Herbaspirillum sp. C7C2]MCI1013771.1 hypothetical protein [Herbaspirillum sp. C7C2]
MKFKRPVPVFLLAFILSASTEQAFAARGKPITRIDGWKPTTEILEYHSCGMADMCWVAELKNKKTRKRIAALRCNGEKLFSILGREPEKIAAANCHAFEDKDKFEQIPRAFRTLLNR